MKRIQAPRRAAVPGPGAALAPAELFDCLDDVVAWIKDSQGRYCWVNRAFLLNLGPGTGSSTQPDEVLGKTDYDLTPAFLADQFRLDDEQVLAGKKIINRIELVSETDEGPVWHVTNKMPLRDASGAIVGTAGITRRLNRHNSAGAAESDFGAVLAHMRDHYHAPIHNKQLAAIACMSVRAFERKFLIRFQTTPQKYLRKLRLRMASRALVYSRQTLVEIGLKCGFADQSHFTREFRRHFGRPPREYREYYAAAENSVPAGTAAVPSRPV